MAIQYDLEHPTSISHFARCRPASVRHFHGIACDTGNLLLRWLPPRGGAPVAGYRIERTPEGQTYETLGETRELWFEVAAIPGESWFYRVTAFNARGATQSRLVCFYRAGDRFMRGGHGVKQLLQHIPVMLGLAVTVCDLIPEERGTIACDRR